MTIPTDDSKYSAPAHSLLVNDALLSCGYEHALCAFRARPVRLLAIGIPDGTALRAWSKYFPLAEKIAGCVSGPLEIAPDSDDARIALAIGVPVSKDTLRSLFGEGNPLDLVVDAGAHDMATTLRGFETAFGALRDGGLYIAEGLGDGYRNRGGRGLYDPLSKASFFKGLADITNFEHWSRAWPARSTRLRAVALEHSVYLSEEILASVGTVEFGNGWCVVRKHVVARNAGFAPAVDERAQLIRQHDVDHANKLVSADPAELAGQLLVRDTELIERHREIVIAIRRLTEVERSLAEAERSKAIVARRCDQVFGELSEAQQTLRQTKLELAKARDALKVMRNSPSWRYTRAFRVAGGLWKRRGSLLRYTGAKVSKVGSGDVRAVPPGQPKLGPALALRRARKVIRQRGLHGAAQHLLERTLRKSTPKAPSTKARPKNPPPAAEGVSRNDYGEWLRRYDHLSDTGRAALASLTAALPRKPLISILLPLSNPTPHQLIAAIESVLGQIYPHWELCIVSDASADQALRTILEHYAHEDARIRYTYDQAKNCMSTACNSGLELATGEWVARMDQDAVLAAPALYFVAEAQNIHPDVRFIYTDEDQLDHDGTRSSPNFKCDFNQELLLSHNMFGNLTVYSTQLVREVGGFREAVEGAHDYDLVLRLVERLKPSQIHHIPRVLYSKPALQHEPVAVEPSPTLLAGQRALNEHFVRTGTRATAELTGTRFYRCRYELPEGAPLVSIIIPTRNAVDLVRKCISSILERTTYTHYEVILIDNGSDDPASLKYFADIGSKPKVRVIRDDRPFNYSALNNAAVVHAKGEFVCLLNNDIEVISPEWLSELLSIGLQHGVGCVGARLWYPNDTLQHGGVVVGILEVAGHAHRYLVKGQNGYQGRAVLVQCLSAVTGACLLIRKSIFEQVGGLNETELCVAYNDVDLCLRVLEAGYRNVWTPYAELYHHESATRGYENTPAKKERLAREARYMKARWGALLKNDPAYNPNLTSRFEDFSLAWPPRTSGFNDF